jgi:hypothetical protein
MRWDCGNAKSACCGAELIVRIASPHGFTYDCTGCGTNMPETTGYVTHQAMDEATGKLPCCGLQLFQCPITDSSTTNLAEVDCPGPPDTHPAKPGKVRRVRDPARHP